MKGAAGQKKRQESARLMKFFNATTAPPLALLNCITDEDEGDLMFRNVCKKGISLAAKNSLIFVFFLSSISSFAESHCFCALNH